MGIERLETIFHPTSVAVVGASERQGSPGRAVLANLVDGGFEGAVHPVHPHRETVMGRPAYPSLSRIDPPVDVVVAAAPMETIPALIAECARTGTAGLIVLSSGAGGSGDTESRLEADIRDAAANGGVRLLGPGSLGLMCAASGLNATVARRMPPPGRLAFISQSGAIGSAIMDVSARERIGFSHFISLGTMLDLDFADLIDYLGADPQVGGILLYMDHLIRHRRFMSAARAVSRIKPIIALKAGRSRSGGFPVPSSAETGIGEDAVFEAAFQRAGIVRVATFEELFDTAEILSRRYRFLGPGLAIVTNAGGPGLMAADHLADHAMQPATLTADTLAALDAALPGGWRHGNPVDIGDDATPDRYAAAVSVLARASEVQALLVMHVATAFTEAEAVARVIARRFAATGLPLITAWLGGADVETSRECLNQAGLATFDTPERAARAFLNLCRHARSVELLQQIPPRLTNRVQVDREAARRIIDAGLASAAGPLTDAESTRLIEAYGIPTAPAGAKASGAEVATLMVGARTVPGFGPVIRFGMGGVPGELMDDQAIALPPLNRLLAGRLIQETRVDRLLRGLHRYPPVDGEALEAILIRLSQLVTDFPPVAELDIDPLALVDGRPVARHVRVRLGPTGVPAPLHLVVSPYPSQHESLVSLPEIGDLLIRPIRPEDAGLLTDLFASLSPRSVYQRFFSPLKQLSPAMLARFTQIDYDREIALVAIRESGTSETMLGAARVILQHNLKDAEFSVLIGDPWQGKGIGAHLLSGCLTIASERKLGTIWGVVLAENTGMLALGRKLGFTIQRSPQAGEFELRLNLTSPAPPRTGAAVAR